MASINSGYFDLYSESKYGFTFRFHWTEEYNESEKSTRVHITKVESQTTSSTYIGTWFPGGTITINGVPIAIMDYNSPATHHITYYATDVWYNLIDASTYDTAAWSSGSVSVMNAEISISLTLFKDTNTSKPNISGARTIVLSGSSGNEGGSGDITVGIPTRQNGYFDMHSDDVYGFTFRFHWENIYDSSTRTSTFTISMIEVLSMVYGGTWYPGGTITINNETLAVMDYNATPSATNYFTVSTLSNELWWSVYTLPGWTVASWTSGPIKSTTANISVNLTLWRDHNTSKPVISGTKTILLAETLIVDPEAPDANPIIERNKQFIEGLTWGFLSSRRTAVMGFDYDVSPKWPENAPITESEVDIAAKKFEVQVDITDKFVLEPEEGTIVVGYPLRNVENNLAFYNGHLLPDRGNGNNTYVFRDSTTGEYILYTIDKGTESFAYIFWSVDNGQYMLGRKQDSAVHYSYYKIKNGSWSYVDGSNYFGISLAWLTGDEVIWAGSDIENTDGTILHHASDYTYEIPPNDNFRITAYKYDTSEFKARWWVRASYSTTGPYEGQIILERYIDSESPGCDFLKDLKYCTRDILYFKNDSRFGSFMENDAVWQRYVK